MLGSRKEKINLQDFVFYIYFVIMFGARAIGLYEGMKIYNVLIIIAMLTFVVKVLSTKHSFIEYIIIMILLGESIIVYLNTGEKGILFYFTLILGMKDISRKTVEKIACILLGISFTILTFINGLRLVDDISYEQYRFPFGNIMRHSLGYPYPNTLMTTYVVFIIILMSVMNKYKVTNRQLWCVTIFEATLGVLLFFESASNTGIIITMLFLFINMFLNLKKNISKIDKIVICSIYPMCLFISILLPYLTYNNRALSSLLNSLSHTRWELSQYYLFNERLSLFGIRFKEMYKPDGYRYMIDSSFLYSFMQVGVITFFIVTILHCCMIKYHVDCENKTELAAIFSLCVLGLSDPFMFNLSYKNIMFLYIGEWLWGYIMKYQKEWKWNREIQLIRCRDINIKIIQWNLLIAFGQKVKDKCVQLLCLYYAFFICLMSLVCALTWKGKVCGTIDEVQEWEYFRYNMAVSHWGGVLIVCIVVMVLVNIEKRRGVDTIGI